MRTISDSIAQGITAQFIAENPARISMGRRQKVATTAGGHTWSAPTYQSAQTFRKVPSGKSLGQKTVVTNSNGKEVIPDWLLVGEIDANVERFDVFDLDDVDYEVVSIDRKQTMQRTVAGIVQHG